MSNQKPSLRFEIENFSKQDDIISSDTFVSGGCNWNISVDPTGYCFAHHGHLSLFLELEDSTMLPSGVKRSFNFYFVLKNQSDKELYRSTIGQASNLFHRWKPTEWVYGKTLPVSKFQEKGFLEKDKLIIEVYIHVVEASDGEGGDVSNKKKKKKKKNESRVKQVEERVKNLELMELGFKLDSLNAKLDKAALEKKKADDTNDSRAQKVEERVKNLEVMDLKFNSLKKKLDEVSLERKKAANTNESHAKQVEKRIKNLELMDLELNKHVKSNRDELACKKSGDAIFLEQIEDRVLDIEFKLESLNTKLEEISKEKKKADDADGSLVQQVKNIELMVSHLKVELDKKKNISSADGFLLVD